MTHYVVATGQGILTRRGIITADDPNPEITPECLRDCSDPAAEKEAKVRLKQLEKQGILTKVSDSAVAKKKAEQAEAKAEADAEAAKKAAVAAELAEAAEKVRVADAEAAAEAKVVADTALAEQATKDAADAAAAIEDDAAARVAGASVTGGAEKKGD